MRSLQVKALTPQDLTAAVDLDRRCLGGLWNLDGYQREIHSPNSDLLVLQRSEKTEEEKSKGQRAKGEGNTRHSTLDTPHSPALLAIGCSWAILEEAHITLLAVDLDYQRQGLGQALLYCLLKAAHNRGLERATLEVRVSNQAAIALYENFGFQTAGRRKRYYAETGEDALVLWRGGLHHPHFPQTLANWQLAASDRLGRSGWQLQELEAKNQEAGNSI
ncbi:ribosomal protein S18-alanine N-acetyltransferase [Phormidium sp. CLA17]|uniref:ribosomal protein S18-alanine N-acetyltransferase n=1 Tax=Leptolyngbya sp. Cla-17 TaxID=2803751 RepID=UPI001491C6A8|nr:ribosomal protein S18-alanine N-acetyltransferase [Leptolyngbya sp. Cla-17]MBM0740309.1 ribosomal protein S18-alanine N-acetyltransferase [Leptolyngbya sp. Cla-17]